MRLSIVDDVEVDQLPERSSHVSLARDSFVQTSFEHRMWVTRFHASACREELECQLSFDGVVLKHTVDDTSMKHLRVFELV